MTDTAQLADAVPVDVPGELGSLPPDDEPVAEPDPVPPALAAMVDALLASATALQAARDAAVELRRALVARDCDDRIVRLLVRLDLVLTSDGDAAAQLASGLPGLIQEFECSRES